MGNKYSPYHYVDLSRDTWNSLSDDARIGAEEKGHRSNEREAAEDVDFNSVAKKLFDFPTRLKDRGITRNLKRICVIGGGIAGLTAAYELTERGHEVTLLEASNRLGGRMLTHYFNEELKEAAPYAELGAMRIPEVHGCVRHYVDRFGLETRAFVGLNSAGYLYLKGRVGRRIDCLQNLEQYENLRAECGLMSPSNYIAEELLKSMTFYFFLEERYDELCRKRPYGGIGLDDLDAIFNDFKVPDHLVQFEDFSLRQVMQWKDTLVKLREGEIDAGEKKGEESKRRKPTKIKVLSDEAWELLGRSTGILWFEDVACLQWLLNEKLALGQDKYELVGGMDTLIRKFEEKINEKANGRSVLNKNASVHEVIDLGGQVRVRWGADGDEAFDYVICAVPAPAVARITFAPDLPAKQREALASLAYSNASKTVVRCTERFWELRDHIFGGGSFSDEEHQQCWYPSDNSMTDGHRHDQGVKMLGGEAIKFAAKDPEQSKRPGAFTAAYMWGRNADRLDSLPGPERTNRILSSVEKMHNGIRNHIESEDTDVKHHSWGNDPNLGGGAFALFAPGQQSRYQAVLGQPFYEDFKGNPHLFFAGEHLAICHAWIQNAIQSALCSVSNILDLCE